MHVCLIICKLHTKLTYSCSLVQSTQTRVAGSHVAVLLFFGLLGATASADAGHCLHALFTSRRWSLSRGKKSKYGTPPH